MTDYARLCKTFDAVHVLVYGLFSKGRLTRRISGILIYPNQYNVVYPTYTLKDHPLREGVMHRESIVLIYRTSFSYVFFSHSIVQHITFCVLCVLEIKVLYKFLVAEMRKCTTELEREDKKMTINEKYEKI